MRGLYFALRTLTNAEGESLRDGLPELISPGCLFTHGSSDGLPASGNAGGDWPHGRNAAGPCGPGVVRCGAVGVCMVPQMATLRSGAAVWRPRTSVSGTGLVENADALRFHYQSDLPRSH